MTRNKSQWFEIYRWIKFCVTLLFIGNTHGSIGRIAVLGALGDNPFNSANGTTNWFGHVVGVVVDIWRAETIFMACDVPQLMYGVVGAAADSIVLSKHIGTVTCVFENKQIL